MLALLGAAGGVAVHALLDVPSAATPTPARLAAATFIGISLLTFAHVWTRGLLLRQLPIALAAGAVLALVFLWNGTPMDGWSSGQSWRVVAALLSVYILVPLAQAGVEHEGGLGPRFSISRPWPWLRARFPYGLVHDHGWTNLLVAGLSVLFAGAFFLMLLLMGELFALVKITLLRTALREGIVIAGLWGAALGASTGLLRDRQRIIGSLQGVAMMVLRVAAPVLAVAMGLFLLILPLAGLSALWDATRATTPIVLGAAIVALLLANSVIGNGGEGEEARASVLRGAAMILCVVVAPLALIAAISTGLRVGQHGWSPERLWAATFVGMSCIVGLAYLIALVRGRGRWAEAVRDVNLGLAFLVCLVALILSTPLVRFDAIATRDQVARLMDGRIDADAFDYKALWFDFGPAGRDAIRSLGRSAPSIAIRRRARLIQQATSRYATPPQLDAELRGAALDRRLSILPQPIPLEPALRERLVQYDLCDATLSCLIVHERGSDHAIVVALPVKDCKSCMPVIRLLYRGTGSWRDPVEARSETELRARYDAWVAAIRAGRAEVREVGRRQIFIDGQPVGDPIPLPEGEKNRTAP